MAAPTRAVQKLQKILANDGPSTHGLLPKFSTQLNSFGVSVRGLWSTSAKSNPAAVAKIVDLTRWRDRLIPLGGG